MATIRSVIQVTVSGTAARSTAMEKNFSYALSASTDLYFLQGDSAVTAAANTGMFLKAGAIFVVRADEDDERYISAIQASAGGTLTIARMGNE